jgi:hypothetical protein
MLAEAVRNTQTENKRLPKAKKVRGWFYVSAASSGVKLNQQA